MLVTIIVGLSCDDFNTILEYSKQAYVVFLAYVTVEKGEEKRNYVLLVRLVDCMRMCTGHRRLDTVTGGMRVCMGAAYVSVFSQSVAGSLKVTLLFSSLPKANFK